MRRTFDCSFQSFRPDDSPADDREGKEYPDTERFRQAETRAFALTTGGFKVRWIA